MTFPKLLELNTWLLLPTIQHWMDLNKSCKCFKVAFLNFLKVPLRITNLTSYSTIILHPRTLLDYPQQNYYKVVVYDQGLISLKQIWTEKLRKNTILTVIKDSDLLKLDNLIMCVTLDKEGNCYQNRYFSQLMILLPDGGVYKHHINHIRSQTSLTRKLEAIKLKKYIQHTWNISNFTMYRLINGHWQQHYCAPVCTNLV